MRGMFASALPFRLAAIDIDDTLVGDDKRISPENASAIARLRAAGCRVVLASGREHSSMLSFHDALDLDEYLVSSQGALVRHARTGTRLWHRPVESSLATHLVDEGLRRGVDVLLYTTDGIFVERESPWASGARARVDATLRFHPSDLRALAAAAPLKVLWYAPPAVVAALAVECAAVYGSRAEIVVTAPELLEFNAPDATKATAVATVATHYGVAQTDVVAFGDGLNDVALLRWAGCGVAVSHAQPEARDAADLVVPEGDANTSLARGIALILTGAALPDQSRG
jgi:Cof subfamily protein (haloacid dehalogenase superfamily)